MILSGTMHKLHRVYTLIFIQTFIPKLMFPLNKAVIYFAVVTINKITWEVKNVAFCVYLLQKGVEILSREQK